MKNIKQHKASNHKKYRVESFILNVSMVGRGEGIVVNMLDVKIYFKYFL